MGIVIHFVWRICYYIPFSYSCNKCIYPQNIQKKKKEWGDKCYPQRLERTFAFTCKEKKKSITIKSIIIIIITIEIIKLFKNIIWPENYWLRPEICTVMSRNTWKFDGIRKCDETVHGKFGRISKWLLGNETDIEIVPANLWIFDRIQKIW